MSTKARPSSAVPRSRSAPEPMRRPAPRASALPARDHAAPRVLDAVRDQHGALWVNYGTQTRAAWVPVTAFVKQNAFERLVDLDPGLIRRSAQESLRKAITNHRRFRPAQVADAPGWVGQCFVLGNGEVLAPRDYHGEVIVTFTPHPKFEARGTLRDWQAALGLSVARQPMPLFALALAFVGSLLPFVPPDYLSPLFEFVGGQGSGKSSVSVAAMSVWAGLPGSGTGGGETWDLSPGRFDAVKLIHRHCLLVLDEANLAGATLEARRNLYHHAIFGLTSTGPRQRLGDPTSKPHAQLAVLSTSNRRLSDLITGSAAERGALHERMITVPIDKVRPHGILDHIPEEHADAAKAVEALRAAADLQWGTAGPAFVRRVQGNIVRDEARFRAQLARGLDHERRNLSSITDVPRVQKAFALVALVGRLARFWHILPASWGDPVQAVRTVARIAVSDAGGAALTPAARVATYAERHRATLREVASLGRPLSREAFEACPGFLRHCEGHTELLVPTGQFQAAFQDHRQVMDGLRREGRARTETGQQSKLTIKTPKAICNEGRVYSIVMS